MTASRINAGNTRGRPFQPGNPGKAKGARNKASLAVDALLADEGEALTRKCVALALGGDTVALKLCMDRIAPVRKDRPIAFALPEVARPEDLTRATAALLAGVASGEITPSEAAELGKLVEAHVKAMEAVEFAKRLSALEAGQGGQR